MSLRAAIRQNTPHRIKAVLCFFLLIFYLTGIAQFDALHRLFHPHDHVVAHSEALEREPCHRAIYHHDREHGCGHHAHILVTGKCALCDLITHTDQILLPGLENQPVQGYSVCFVFPSTDIVRIAQSGLPSRAPPVV